MAMEKIDKIFTRQSKLKSFQKPMEAARVCAAANECVLPRGKALSFNKGLLTVSVNSAAGAANMQMESGVILDCINKKLGQNLVEKLRYKIA